MFQVLTPVERVHTNLPHAGRYHHVLEPAAPEPVIAYLRYTIWNGNVLQLPKVPDPHTPYQSIQRWAYYCGFWNFGIRNIRLAAVFDVDS